MASNDESKIGFFLAGLGLGVVAAMLLAPRTGEQTREFLREQADEGREYLKRKSQELRQQAQVLTDQGKEFLSRQREALETAFEAGRRAYQQEKDKSDETNISHS